MVRRSRLWGPALAIALAGCQQPAAPPSGAEPGRGGPVVATPRPTASPTPAQPSATPVASPTATPSARPSATVPGAAVPSGAPTPPLPLPVEARPAPIPRATADRPDDQPGLAVHVLYVLPADAPDGRLDEDGTLAASLGRLDGWLGGETRDGRTPVRRGMAGEAEAGGRKLALDRYQGWPDITCVRSTQTTAQLVGADGEIIDRLRPELARLGFEHPQKVYAAYVMAPGRAPTVGEGGSGLACVYLASEPGLKAPPGPSGLAWYDAAMGHEVFHALGFVAAGAPHFAEAGDQAPQDPAVTTAGTGHVDDDETDLMAATASGGLLALDVGRDDYFGHGKPGLPDLAKSPFLVPAPADAVPPPGRPLALDAGPDAVAIAGPSPLPAADAQAEAAIAAAAAKSWQGAGLTLPPADPRLTDAARRLAAARARGETPRSEDLMRQAGFFGPYGVRFSGLTFGGPVTDAVAFGQLVAGLGAQGLPPTGDDATATAHGVGVASGPAGAVLAFATGRAALGVSGLRLGNGPLGTYTLAGRVQRQPGATATRVLVVLDDTPLEWALHLDAAGQAGFAVTLTRDRAHTVSLGIPDADDRRVAIDAELGTIDARLPLAEAARAIYGAL